MNKKLFTQWHAEGLLSDESFQKIKVQEGTGLFSVYWEIKTLLYLAVLLLSGGLGMLIYKNIDSIGHTAILVFLALLCVGCFYYCLKHAAAWSVTITQSPNAFFDYGLLLGCLCFISIIGYLQYQFNFFGNRYGLASFIPMLLLFVSAYYFDNIGILSMGITNLAAWLGISVTPLEILKANDFNSGAIIITALLLGVFLMAAAWVTRLKKIKKHFEFTFTNFGMHILFIAAIAAMFHFENIYLLWFIVLSGFTFFFYLHALKTRSFYTLLVTTLYAFIGLSYVVIQILMLLDFNNLFPIYLGLIYFIGSGILLVIFLMKNNKKLKANDSL